MPGTVDDAVLVIPPSQAADVESYVKYLQVQGETGDGWEEAEDWEVEVLKTHLATPKQKWQLISGHRVGHDAKGYYILENYIKRYFGVKRRYASVALRASADEAVPVFVANSQDGGLLEKVMREIPKLTVDMRKQVLHAAFRNADANGDGVLSKPELGSLMRRVACHLKQKDVDIMLSKVDTNKDGKIDYKEFTEWVLSQAPESVTQAFERSLKTELDVVKATFRIWDKNGDGLIAKRELVTVMQELWRHEGATKKQVRALIDTVDVDGDGQLDYSEFIEVLFADR